MYLLNRETRHDFIGIGNDSWLGMCAPALAKLFGRDNLTNVIVITVLPTPSVDAQIYLQHLPENPDAVIANGKYTELYRPTREKLGQLFREYGTKDLFVTFYNEELEPLKLC